MVLTLEKWKVVTFQILSPQLYAIPYHWFGRSILCAGADCPACGSRSPRHNFYAGISWKPGQASSVTVVPFERRVVELPESAAIAIESFYRSIDCPKFVGLTVSLARGNTRDVWSVESGKFFPPVSREFAAVELVEQICKMYRLPGAVLGETFSEWFERVRVSQTSALASKVLFS